MFSVYRKASAWIFLLASCLAAFGQRLPGTALLEMRGDLAARMVEDIHAYLDRATAESIGKRAQFGANRERFRTIIGVVDERVPGRTGLPICPDGPSSVSYPGYKVHRVCWPVLKGVTGEGLLLQPNGPPVARVIAIPDAGWTPEMLASQFARRLAESGCQVVIPTLIDRQDTWSGIPDIRMTNMPHREFVMRMAYQVGRHVIGYEVQKILALVDWFERENLTHRAPIAAFGYGEGGLLALYSAASDTRIAGTVVSGYFQSRQEVWKEPIYRHVWSLLREFGDAEIAGLIAPRTLIIEASRGPEVSGPPPETAQRRGAASGRLASPPIDSVRSEVARARPFFVRLNAGKNLQLVESAAPGSEAALQALLSRRVRSSNAAPAHLDYDPVPRMRRQFDELVEHVQMLVRESPKRREEFWAKADSGSQERWAETTRFYRDHLWDEVIGRLPTPDLPPNARTRQIYDEPAFRGYEVVLDVWRGVFAYGILLVPKNLKPGERRPVVVCQHGLEGRPSDVADPKLDHPAYHRYAARLAEEGFVVYAPQNPYIGRDRFRLIHRKAHPLKLSLYSFIVGQHQQTLDWLAGLPFVNPEKIGFYGLSYGGKTAMRVPPLLDRYALSICSADFNEWIWKTTSVEARYSYMITPEYDMLEFNLANVFNYAELASLIAPRPFMVERGHADGVAPDEWVAYEFAKVRRFYATKMKLPERAEIEFFDGPHTINGKGTFEFLRRHLR